MVSARTLTFAVGLLAAMTLLPATSAQAAFSARAYSTHAYSAQADVRVVAVDIDRDGDLDIIAATGGQLTVWVNDGAGHLTSQRPSSGPGIDIHAPWTTFRGGPERSEPTTDDSAPSTALLVVRSHAPPSLTAGDAARPILFVYSSAQLRSSPPRAPPPNL